MRIIAVILMALWGLFGCKTREGNSEKLSSDKPILDTVYLKEANSEKLSFNYKPVLDTADLKEVVVGNLNLPTGKIVAGDPFFLYSQKPFTIKVAPGIYPVSLLIYKVEEDHYRVAFAKIKFSEGPTTHWTLALTEDITDDQIKNLQSGEFFGYGVDAGLGCFADSETNGVFNAAMDRFQKDNPNGNYYDDLLALEFKTASGQHPFSREDGDWTNHFPNKGDNHNVVMFASGWGDGSYPTYWGTDSNGRIVELITDFMVIISEE